jgi:hypothetical protein
MKSDATVLRAARLSKTYFKVFYTSLYVYVSTNIDHHQAFKILDENCFASVL